MTTPTTTARSNPPPSMLDDFCDWLRTQGDSPSDPTSQLYSDLQLARYLRDLPRCHAIRLRQLGSTVTLTHERTPSTRGSISLPGVSLRFQSALANYALERSASIIAPPPDSL